MMRVYRTLPDTPTGYPLDDVWSIVVPVARTNLIQNPSFETNTTSWTAIGGSIARSTTYQYHGAYSLAITPTSATTDGARYDTVSLTTGTTYAYSAKVRGVGGLKYKLAVETTGGVELASVTFTASGRWQWIVGYYTETSSTTRRVTARKASHASTAVFYLDGVQVETIVAGELASTYLDGDQIGLVPNQQPPAYVWNGTPHASTSTRSGQTRAGGMVIPFKRYGFILTAMIGLGLASVQNIATDYARIDGGYDAYTRKMARQFTLTGRFQGKTYAELRRNRSELAQLFDRDMTGQDQRLTLLRRVEDGYGRIVSSDIRVLAKYESGFGGNTDNMHAETVPLTFTQYLPSVLSDGESGGAVSVQTTLSVSAITKRSASGVWSILGTGLNSSAQDILVASTGLVYVTGQFSTAGGGAAAAIAVWNPATSAWSALGTGLSGGGATGYALAEAPNGDIYVGGDFTDAGGSGADYIAKWNGSAWSVVGSATAINNIVRGLAIGPTGIVYAGGDFTNAGGDANADQIAQWNGVAWSALGSGTNGIVRSIIVLPDSTLYAGGDFTTADGNAAVKIAYWNGSAWSAMGAGLTGGGTNRAFKLALGKNNLLYVGGTFTAAGGVAASNIAVWNGVAFAPLGSGTTPADVRNMVITADGQLIISGDFTSAGGVGTTGGLARWNGAAWVPMDSDLAGGPIAAALALSPGGDLYSSTNIASMVSAGITTITNPGTANSYPVITINGPTAAAARVYGIWNYTTNRAIYLNYTPNIGENATLTLQPDNLSFVSDFRGNIMSLVMPGSNIADFFLQPGANSIGLFASGSTTTAVIAFRVAYASIDDVP